MKEILCTLGPASLNEHTIRRLTDLGVNLFRMNLSHIALEEVEPFILEVRRHTTVPLCLDTEGAQFRTGKMRDREVILLEHDTLELTAEPIAGTKERFSLYPDHAVELLEEGDIVSIDFNSVLAQVVKRTPGSAVLRILNGGKTGSNKAVTVHRDVGLPVLTPKDRAAIAIGLKHGIRHVALSFANRGADVDEIRSLCAPGTFLISKVECRNALIHLNDIVAKSDAILIDRGDLSREEPIERIPRLQKMILQCAKTAGRKAYVATNLLESMVTHPHPTRAEVNDVVNTLMDGADGLVLAAETAIGKNPIGCASMIRKLIREFERGIVEPSYQPSEIESFLTEPHGGELILRDARPEDLANLKRLPRVPVPLRSLMDAEQIAVGTFSPLEGFMGAEALASVLERNALPSGIAWTMPILLPAGEALKKFGKGDSVLLTHEDGEASGAVILEVEQIFDVNPSDLARKWYGTDDASHPGAARVRAEGGRYAAGKVRLVKAPVYPCREYAMRPSDSRLLFTHKGWMRVVGFHTRNLPHRAHEFVQLEAMQKTHADGLFISPAAGPARAGDFKPELVFAAYRRTLGEGIYPEGRAALGAFASYPRFAGPREAVFTAICRQNMGCSHFIVGRNHSGLAGVYADDAYKKLFDSLDVAIRPVFFEEIVYDTQREAFVPRGEAGKPFEISGTQIREKLQKGEPLPAWVMRPSVQELVMREMTAGRGVFAA